MRARLARLYRQGRADRWSAMFGQIAVYSFVVTAISGVFLLFYFKPSTTAVTYHGSYSKLDGVPMSQAYQSTLDLSFDVRGGLLMRQIHHWAALLFVAAVCGHLLRLYFTGAFRRRWLDWIIWVTMLALGMVAGLSGTILPDDSMSGGSLDVLAGVTMSVPVIGTHLALWIFGGDFPGHEIIGRAYWVHVAVLPGVMVGLFGLLRWRERRGVGQRRRGRGPGRRGRRGGSRGGRGRRGGREQLGELGWPLVTPGSVVMFLFTCAALAVLGTFAQVNPVWLVGPYQPGSISAGAVPGWYMGFVDGALRIMPGWEVSVAGHPLILAVLVPGVLMPGVFFTALAAYPLLDRRLTADARLERPRDAAIRTAVGAAGITFYGLLWAAAANDEIAYHFRVSLYAVTWFFRIAVLAGPIVAFGITERLCLGLARRDRDEAEHGRETGRIVMSPDGGYHEIRDQVRTLVAAGAADVAGSPDAAGASGAAGGGSGSRDLQGLSDAGVVEVVQDGREADSEHLPTDCAEQLGHEEPAWAGETGVVVGETGAAVVRLDVVGDVGGIAARAAAS